MPYATPSTAGGGDICCLMPSMPAARVAAISKYGLELPQPRRFSMWVRSSRVFFTRTATLRFSKPHDALLGANDHSLYRLAQLTVGAANAVSAGAWATMPAMNWRATSLKPSALLASRKALWLPLHKDM